MTNETSRTDMVWGVLEGVAFAFANGQLALKSGGLKDSNVSVIGGSSKSKFWTQVLSDVLGKSLLRHQGSSNGPAFGAARLARTSCGSYD